MAPIDPVAGLAAVTALISALGVGGVLRERSRSRALVEAEKQKAAAAIAAAEAEAPQKMADGLAMLSESVNQQTRLLIERLTKDIDRLEREAAKMRDEAAKMRDEIAKLRQDHETCLSDGRGMAEKIARLHQALIDNGIDLEPHEMPDSLILLDGGKAKVISAPRRRPRKP